MQISICSQISEIEAQQWNAMVKDNHPFLKHEFLDALERYQCVGEKFGWIPHHIAIYAQEKLIAAMPLYEKHNSYGEFVFDHAWAEAYQRHGFEYFPKLVSAVPYTPAQGQRMLIADDYLMSTNQHHDEIYDLLLNTAKKLGEHIGASGFHCLFPLQSEHEWLASRKLLTRHDCQFHWTNRGYADFDEFLSQLNSAKRKNIRKERRKVEQQGITFRLLSGHTATEKDWQDFSRFYQHTFESKWGTATLNFDFFYAVAQRLPDQVLLVLADYDHHCIAGSLMYQSDKTLYGRFWGADKSVKQLHFEACYYQGLDYCINKGLKTFEPGAQGEHKISRGFVPTLTRSSHLLLKPHFEQAIKQYVVQEQDAIASYMQQLNQHLPYKKDG